MKRCTMTFLFYNMIAPAFQHPAPQNDLTVGVNAVYEALASLGLTGSSIDWESAFARLAERYHQRGVAIRQLNVLNFIYNHLEILSLQLDPIDNTMENPLISINASAIPAEDIPLSCRGGRTEADFKKAYAKWYRIIMNSKDSRIVALIAAIKHELSNDKTPLTERDIAKSLAVIWCTVYNEMLSYSGSVIGQLAWKNADEVANAYNAFQSDAFYINFVQILFKVTMFGFGDRLPTTKKE